MRMGCDDPAGSEGLIEHSVCWVWTCRAEDRSYIDVDRDSPAWREGPEFGIFLGRSGRSSVTVA